jgi:hypothetical protein
MTSTSDRYTALPDEATLAATVVALEEHGFSVNQISHQPAHTRTTHDTHRNAGA